MVADEDERQVGILQQALLDQLGVLPVQREVPSSTSRIERL